MIPLIWYISHYKIKHHIIQYHINKWYILSHMIMYHDLIYEILRYMYIMIQNCLFDIILCGMIQYYIIWQIISSKCCTLWNKILWIIQMIQYCFMYNIYIIVLCWACCRLRLMHYVANPDYNDFLLL